MILVAETCCDDLVLLKVLKILLDTLKLMTRVSFHTLRGANIPGSLLAPIVFSI